MTSALDAVGRLVSLVPLIPELVERLHALKELHERAAQFAGSVAYIAESQDQLALQTKDLKALLAQVRRGGEGREGGREEYALQKETQ